MPTTKQLLDEGALTVADVEREIRARFKLGDRQYANKFVSTIVDSCCKALLEPDIEVRVSFDSITELSEAAQLVSKTLVDNGGSALVDWEESKGDCIEFLNGSALHFIGPKGKFYIRR